MYADKTIMKQHQSIINSYRSKFFLNGFDENSPNGSTLISEVKELLKKEEASFRLSRLMG